MANWNEMSKAAQKAASTAAHIVNELEIQGKTHFTMTEATTAIWGTSGTGNSNAVRLIEATAAMGFLKIVPHGKRTRYVEAGSKAIPPEAMSQEDKDFAKKMRQDTIQMEADAMERRVREAIKTDPSTASTVFMSELAGFLGAGRRRR
jgi:hypothetical protein